MPREEDLIDKQNWQVSEKDIHEISNLLGARWWEMFARKIGFHSEVEEIKREYVGLHNQKYQLLLQWSSRHGKKGSYGIILKALSELKEINALDKVCKLLHAQSEPGPPLPSALERYSDELKSVYSRYKLEAIVDWPPPPTESIVKLAMIGGQNIDEMFIDKIREGKVEDVLNTKTEIKVEKLYRDIGSGGGKVILIEGAPGCGKTTLCWLICHQWAKLKLKSLKNISHIIMVELRAENIGSMKNLEDMLPYCEGDLNKTRVAEELINKRGENVVIILEGWNELPRSMRKKSFFRSLINKGDQCPLQQAVILITSRSNTTVDLRPTLRIEALGFTPGQIEEYVRGCFDSEPHKAVGLLERFRQNPKLERNCYLPLILIIIIHLYNLNKPLPESFCGIITELARSCIYSYCYKKGICDVEDDDETFSFDTLPPEVDDKFCKLCKLAFDTTIEEKYSFSNPDMDADGLGLLQSVRSLARTGSSATQYFIHSSLQECCAALHVSKQPIEDQVVMLEKLFAAPKDYVLRFYSALTHWENESVREVLLECSKTIHDATAKYSYSRSKSEPLSQSLVAFLNILQTFPSRFVELLKYFHSTVTGDKPFDRDKLQQLCSMGGPEMEPFVNAQAKLLEEEMMKLRDESLDPDEYHGFDIDKMSNEMKKAAMTAMEQMNPANGMDKSKWQAFGQTMYDKMAGLSIAFLKCIQETNDGFGTSEIPSNIFVQQVMQKLHDMQKQLPAPEDPRHEMGFQPTPAEQVKKDTDSFFQDQIKKFAGDGRVADIMNSIIPHMMGTDPNPNPNKIMEAFMKILNRTSQTSTLSQQTLWTSLIHGIRANNMLMLIHCVYESKNPALSQIIGSTLVLAGQINTSDLIALQCVLEMRDEDGKPALELEVLHLFTALPPSDIHLLNKTIMASSTIHTLTLNVGYYNEHLIRTMLRIPRLRKLSHSWIIQNEEKRRESCESFFNCLEHNQNLQVLNLTCVQILDVGAKELARVLNTTRLVEIAISRCGIQEEGIKALSTALGSNNCLSVLCLDDTIISPAALQSLSTALRQNNTLKVIGMVEDPLTSELKEEHLQKFIIQLCFNSSVICLVLNTIHLIHPSLHQAMALVNCTRKLKQQPKLSIDDHYTQNYSPQIFSEDLITQNILTALEINSSDIANNTEAESFAVLRHLLSDSDKKQIQSINCSVVKEIS